MAMHIHLRAADLCMSGAVGSGVVISQKELAATSAIGEAAAGSMNRGGLDSA